MKTTLLTIAAWIRGTLNRQSLWTGPGPMVHCTGLSSREARSMRRFGWRPWAYRLRRDPGGWYVSRVFLTKPHEPEDEEAAP